MNRLLPWPMPALLVWTMAWLVYLALRGLQPGWAAVAALGVAMALSAVAARGWWRRLFVVAGFVLSMGLSSHGPWAEMAAAHTALQASSSPGAFALPSALWLLPLALLLLIYPVQAWRDAPMFPTPPQALLGLAQATGLPSHARVLDAGCGLGHGLQALRLAMPNARIEGVERSWPLRAAAGWRCRFAQVRQGDMWRTSWHGLDLVYLFQRPESMARAWAKAEAEMAEGAWLASLEFVVPQREPDALLPLAHGKAVRLYRIGARRQAQSTAPVADKPRKTLDRPLAAQRLAR